jgi:hypothetical protein
MDKRWAALWAYIPQRRKRQAHSNVKARPIYLLSY